jgi:hypothetical protein
MGGNKKQRVTRRTRKSSGGEALNPAIPKNEPAILNPQNRIIETNVDIDYEKYIQPFVGEDAVELGVIKYIIDTNPKVKQEYDNYYNYLVSYTENLELSYKDYSVKSLINMISDDIVPININIVNMPTGEMNMPTGEIKMPTGENTLSPKIEKLKTDVTNIKSQDASKQKSAYIDVWNHIIKLMGKSNPKINIGLINRINKLKTQVATEEVMPVEETDDKPSLKNTVGNFFNKLMSKSSKNGGSHKRTVRHKSRSYHLEKTRKRL